MDRKKALARLSSVKDDEIAAAAIGWEKKVTDLLEQVKMELKRVTRFKLASKKMSVFMSFCH